MLNSRLIGLGVLLSAGLCVQGWLDHRAEAQVAEAKPVDVDPSMPEGYEEEQAFDKFRLPEDRTAWRKFEEVRRLMGEQAWSDVAQLLQHLLDEREDRFFEDDNGRWLSVRNEANRILSEAPKEALQFYEQKVGFGAKQALDEAKRRNSPSLLAEVALRYMHTTAGAEAAMLLGTQHLDQGRYVVAALCFERLLQREGQLDKFNALALYKATVAFQHAGDKKNVDRLKPIFARKLGDRSLPQHLAGKSVDDLLVLAGKADRSAPRDRFDWPMFGGDLGRTAYADGGAPFLDPRWTRDATTTTAKTRIEQIINTPAIRNKAVLSGYHPIAVNGKVIYRSVKGLHALDIKSGDEVWETPSRVGLEQCLNSLTALDDKNQQMVQWVNSFGFGQNGLMFIDNSLIGTLSTDNERVYYVEDLAVPPHPIWLQSLKWNQWQLQQLSKEISPWMHCNQLRAFDLEDKRLVWILGGTGTESDPFNDTFFLGPPLPMGDKLYVLAEVRGQIQLLCLHVWTEKGAENKITHRVALQWRHPLGDVERRLLEDPVRRTQACHLSYADGMLICPTNCGAVVAVDLLTRTTVWAKAYGDRSPGEPATNPRIDRGYPNQQLALSTWATGAPIIHRGKVIFAAPDSKGLYCLNLRDGDHVWSISKSDNDLYLAGVFGGNALIVGRESCRAISIDTGKEAWAVATEGVPSGRGVAASAEDGAVYFLPLKKRSTGAVMAINLDNRTVSVSPAPREQVPGNLIFHDGDVLSQGLYTVHAYPQLKVKEKQMNEALARNQNDPFGLTERGELLLYQGKLKAAYDDLTLALQHNPTEEVRRKARTKLYDTLSGLLERDFTKFEQKVGDLEELIAIPEPPDEKPEDKAKRTEVERDRWARFHRMVAKGKEEQAFKEGKTDKLVDAFQAYLKFAGLGHNELIPIPDEPTTRVLPELWAQARIKGMIARCNPSQRETIENALKQEWEKAEKAGSVEALRAFVGLFGPVSEQGQKANLLLAENLIQANDIIEGENRLWSLFQSDYERKSSVAAQALDALARMYTRQGDLLNATYYFGLLSRNYPKLVVRDGKTGDELYQELAMDKRFLAFLDGGSSGNGWALAETFKGTVQNGLNQQQYAWLSPQGEVPPSHRKYRIGINFNSYPNVMAKLQDRLTGDTVHDFKLEGLRLYVDFTNSRTSAILNCHVIGRTMVFQWGHWVYGVDPVQKKVLWKYNNLGSLNPDANNMIGPNLYVIQTVILPNGMVEIWYSDNTRERIGHLVTADANCVCFLVKDEGLVAVDPGTGQKRWVKSDIAVGTELFGDGEFLIAPAGEGGKPQAFRTLDGSHVPIQDFNQPAKGNQSKIIQRHGRNLLFRDSAKEGVVLRLYDIIAGKDVWKKEFPADAIPLTCASPALAGVLDRKGKLAVFRLDSGKDVVAAEIDPESIDAKAPPQEVHLVEDSTAYYLAFNQPQRDANSRRISPNGLLMRNIVVNGPLFAFDKNTGKEKWKQEVPAQQLALDQFDDNPLLLFSTWVQRFGRDEDAPPIRRNTSAVLAIDKRNGKIVYDNKSVGGNRGWGQFHTLKLDPRSGTIELQRHDLKVVITVGAEAKEGTSAAPDPGPEPPPGRARPRRPIPVEPETPPEEVPPMEGPPLINPLFSMELDEYEKLRPLAEAIVQGPDGAGAEKLECLLAEHRRLRRLLIFQRQYAEDATQPSR